MSELQTQRVIQVYDGVTSEDITLNTSFSKWTDIAPLIEEAGISLNNKNAVLRSTKGILHFPDALVPEGNQVIYLVQAKMKSGATKVVKPLSDMSYLELRRAYKVARDKDSNLPSLGGNPTIDELVKSLSKIHGITELKGSSKATKEKKKEVVNKVKEIAKKTEPILEERIAALETILGKTIEGFGAILDKLRGTKTSKSTKVVTVKEESSVDKPMLSKEELRKGFADLQ